MEPDRAIDEDRQPTDKTTDNVLRLVADVVLISRKLCVVLSRTDHTRLKSIVIDLRRLMTADFQHKVPGFD